MIHHLWRPSRRRDHSAACAPPPRLERIHPSSIKSSSLTSSPRSTQRSSTRSRRRTQDSVRLLASLDPSDFGTFLTIQRRTSRRPRRPTTSSSSASRGTRGVSTFARRPKWREHWLPSRRQGVEEDRREEESRAEDRRSRAGGTPPRAAVPVSSA